MQVTRSSYLFSRPGQSATLACTVPMTLSSNLVISETQSYCQSAISGEWSHSSIYGVLGDRPCLISDIALVLYEYIITFGQEVQFIWGSGATGAIIIFYLNRCVMVGVGIMNALSIINWNANAVCCVDFTDRRCPHSLWVSEVLYHHLITYLKLKLIQYSTSTSAVRQ